VIGEIMISLNQLGAAETVPATETTRMLVTETLWETSRAARYMAQLCKHSAHRVPVVLNEADGKITFSFGSCDAIAEPAGLRLRATAPDAEDMKQLQNVVISHLQRFAFREMTEAQAAAIAWTDVHEDA
jgi:uncharacterized protein